MAQSTQVVQTKMLDYFFSLRKLHTFAYQPIVTLATGELYEYECLFRPQMPMLPAVDQLGRPGGDQHRPRRRARHLHRGHRARAHRPARGDRARGRHAAAPLRHQPHAVQPARQGVRGVRAGRPGPRLRPRAAPDHDRVHRAAVRPRPRPLQRQVKALRRLGFGFAVDDAGAGYASFALIAALEPSVIKIDRDIVHRAQPRRRQAGTGRGLRLVRPPDRGAPPGRRHRTPRRPRRADVARRRARPGLPAREAGRRSRSRRGC